MNELLNLIADYPLYILPLLIALVLNMLWSLLIYTSRIRGKKSKR